MLSRVVSNLLMGCALSTLVACGDGSTGSADGGDGVIGTGVYSGVAQKGPLLLGSTVTVQEIDAKLSPTGKQYSYQINSDLGTFSATSTFTSKYLGINATGYYFDEVTNGISTGPVTLNGISDLNTDTTLNVNLLTTLAYQRTKNLVNTSGMNVAAARNQAEKEVLAAFGIRNGAAYGSFGSFDISKRSDGDGILTALSSVFVYGNSPGALSSLIANFQSDIADNGVIDTAATQAALTSAATQVNPTVIAYNLSQKYGASYTAADISKWIDQNGDGVLGAFEFQIPNATPTSMLTFPASVVDQVIGATVSVTSGQLFINGSPATTAPIHTGDVLAVTPDTGGAFPQGIVTTYLLSGTAKIAKVSFVNALQSIAVTPAAASQPSGLTQQFVATGTFSDTSTADITTLVTWSSGEPTIATINSNTGQSYAVTPGVATITAASGTVASNAASFTVTPAVLQSFTITPNALYTGVGITRQILKATGTYSDGSTADLTTQATWSSDDPGIATVNTASGAASGVALGATAVTAKFNGMTSSAVLNVTANSWSAAASLERTRSGHTATLLPNGKVLVAGGESGGPSYAELYDSTTNSWQPTGGNLITARRLHTATLLPNGKVLVVGGVASIPNGTTAFPELYDPATNSWSPARSLTITSFLYDHTATLLNNGKVLVVGGYGGAGKLSTAQIYDPVTDSWSSAQSLITPRRNHTATLLTNGTVLVAGGDDLLSAEIYDPFANSWSPAGNLATARGGHTATLLASGKVLVAGGFTSSAELYDPTTNSWLPAGSLLPARGDHTATVLSNGQVLVAGGQISYDIYLSNADIYDPTTNWLPTENLVTARTGCTATLLPNGMVLVVGGTGVRPGFVQLASTELYWQ